VCAADATVAQRCSSTLPRGDSAIAGLPIRNGMIACQRRTSLFIKLYQHFQIIFRIYFFRDDNQFEATSIQSINPVRLYEHATSAGLSKCPPRPSVVLTFKKPSGAGAGLIVSQRSFSYFEVRSTHKHFFYRVDSRTWRVTGTHAFDSCVGAHLWGECSLVLRRASKPVERHCQGTASRQREKIEIDHRQMRTDRHGPDAAARIPAAEIGGSLPLNVGYAE
jgi:hypothetical protein